MPVDLTTKQGRMAAAASITRVRNLPEPDGTIDKMDRWAVAGFYDDLDEGIPPTLVEFILRTIARARDQTSGRRWPHNRR